MGSLEKFPDANGKKYGFNFKIDLCNNVCQIFKSMVSRVIERLDWSGL